MIRNLVSRFVDWFDEPVISTRTTWYRQSSLNDFETSNRSENPGESGRNR